MTVVVKAKSSKKPSTSILSEGSTYEVITGNSIILPVKLLPKDTDDYVTYSSSDESIATVNALGKVVGYAKGTAYITITASSGRTKKVKINVTTDDSSKEVSLELNVLYCDDTLKYYENELGASITVKENGQYTLSFDCATNLSDNVIKAGVTSLNNLTAVYIKDLNVTNGRKSQSPAVSCNIVYNKIVVDGQSLTITQTEPKNAIKNSGILDTNGPLNAWEDNIIKEITATNHILNFTSIKNPKKIEIIFTISNLKFAE